MSIIKVLPTELKNKIAAGEVVERPASVLKELTENSIDAGATRIDVEIKKGGVALIRVKDNGAGMDEADARLSLMRHATSKLASEDDLFNISTMGFRGEALPSIASVSIMHISTAPKDAPSGITLTIEGGVITESKASPANGTIIEVRDLFYNTPARRKFLKRESTEMIHIVEVLTQLALSHPMIGFTLTTDSKRSMDIPPAETLKERITQVYGAEFAGELLEVDASSDQYEVSAFISKPKSMHQRRTHQYLFINGRAIKDASLSHAVYGSYDGLAPRGRHPVFFAFLSVPPSEVDFNVHPAKREVRFAHKDSVYKFLRHSANQVLRELRIDEALEQYEDDTVDGSGNRTAPTQGVTMPQPAEASPLNASHTGSPAGIAESATTWNTAATAEPLPMQYTGGTRHIYLGESFLAYPGRDGLIVLDHHAAHERVLYEKLLSGLSPESNMLLFPAQVKLSHKEYLTILDNKSTLVEMGMDVDDFGQDTIVVRSMPIEMQKGDLRGILSDAAAAMREGEKPNQNLMEALAASLACHSSIRGSRAIGPEELSALIMALDMTDDPEHCPHGRPTRLFYTTGDLRKAFKRT